jgi:hypothetical protein
MAVRAFYDWAKMAALSTLSAVGSGKMYRETSVGTFSGPTGYLAMPSVLDDLAGVAGVVAV